MMTSFSMNLRLAQSSMRDPADRRRARTTSRCRFPPANLAMHEYESDASTAAPSTWTAIRPTSRLVATRECIEGSIISQLATHIHFATSPRLRRSRPFTPRASHDLRRARRRLRGTRVLFRHERGLGFGERWRSGAGSTSDATTSTIAYIYDHARPERHVVKAAYGCKLLSMTCRSAGVPGFRGSAGISGQLFLRP